VPAGGARLGCANLETGCLGQPRLGGVVRGSAQLPCQRFSALPFACFFWLTDAPFLGGRIWPSRAPSAIPEALRSVLAAKVAGCLSPPDIPPTTGHRKSILSNHICRSPKTNLALLTSFSSAAFHTLEPCQMTFWFSLRFPQQFLSIPTRDAQASARFVSQLVKTIPFATQGLWSPCVGEFKSLTTTLAGRKSTSPRRQPRCQTSRTV